jgi:hypothetical protein
LDVTRWKDWQDIDLADISRNVQRFLQPISGLPVRGCRGSKPEKLNANICFPLFIQ